MRPGSDVVEVRAWGQSVGSVAIDLDTGCYAFTYSPEWQDRGVELAPMYMPLRPEPYEFRDLPIETFDRLPALLADALPDRFGRAVIDKWMAATVPDVGELTALDRLVWAGDHTMGALTFRPAAESVRWPSAHLARDLPETPVSTIHVADLVLAARQVLRGRVVTEPYPRHALRQLVAVGTTAGGAQPKAVVLYNPATGQLRSPHAPREPGFVDYLLKLDGTNGAHLGDHVEHGPALTSPGRIEYAYHLMATAAGIEMAPSELFVEGPRAHFLTRRFDRGPVGQRHHILSLCALAHLDFNMVGAHSYDQYLAAISELGLGPQALAEAYRRMVFNVTALNRDDHTKNLSFRLGEGGAWELAPAYDITYTHRTTMGWSQRHQMRVNGRTADITHDDLYAVGRRRHVPGFHQIVSDVVDAVTDWSSYAALAHVSGEVAERIANELRHAEQPDP